MPPRILRAVLAVAALCLLAVAWPQAALAQQRVALVVGNGAYRAVPRLANPVADAEAVAEALRGAGFRTELLRDAGKEALGAALRRLGAAAEGAELALFYFAGHGIQIGGENHLLPVDARLAHVRDVDYELVGVPLVLRTMQGARARVLILDACRDNPLAAQMRGLSATRSVGRGLARVESVDLGTLIAFSTSPGAVALDGTGRNSPFTQALVQHLATPGLEIRQLMTRVRRSVVEATGGQQIPWDNSSLITEVVLRPGRAPAVAAAPPPPAPAVAAPAPARPQAPAQAPPAQATLAPSASARIIEVATRQGIPLPSPMPTVAAARGAHPLVGIWGGEARWNRAGRTYLLAVLSVDAASGTADVLMGTGAGVPGTMASGYPPGWARVAARVSGGTLRWQDERGDLYEARRTDFFGELVEIKHTRIGGARVGNPSGEIALPRLE
jgi:hypothetical protein